MFLYIKIASGLRRPGRKGWDRMLIRGKYVLTEDGEGRMEFREDYAVQVRGNRIQRVGPYAQLKEQCPWEEVLGDGSQLLMPGLVDAHTHGAGLSYVQRGVTLDYLENALLKFATAFQLKPETTAALNAARHLQNGCTTLHHNDSGAALDPHLEESCARKIQGYQSTGIRLGFSPGIRNKNVLAYDDRAFLQTLPPDLQKEAAGRVYIDQERAVEEYMAAFEALYARYNGDRTRIFFGPNWVQGSTDSFLLRVKERADQLGKIPIHLHCLQTPVQKAFGLRTYGKSLVGHLDDLGLVDSNLVLGHGVYLNQGDIALLAEKDAYVTHHASCNLIMRDGIAPVYNMLQAGMNVAMGMDEKSINDDEDPFMEMRVIYFLHRHAGISLTQCPALSPYDVLRLATRNGARPTDFAGEIGALVPGLKADLILVDLKEMLEQPCMLPGFDMGEVLLRRGLGRHVDTVMVDGQVVMRGRKLLTIDLEALYQQVREEAAAGRTQAQLDNQAFLEKIRPYYQNWYNGWLEELELDPFYVYNSKA